MRCFMFGRKEVTSLNIAHLVIPGKLDRFLSDLSYCLLRPAAPRALVKVFSPRSGVSMGGMALGFGGWAAQS